MRIRLFLPVLLATAGLLAACTIYIAPAPIADAPPANAETATPASEAPDSGMPRETDHGQMMDAALPFDAQFIDSMIEHHQGAIDMAHMALEEAEHDELRDLASAIIADQQTEIEQMHEWRAAWHPDLPPTKGMGMAMGEMSIAEDAGAPFDQRFLEAMISHHLGAVAMAQAAQAQAEYAELRRMADDIIAAQEGEIAQMRRWLSAWYGIEETEDSAAVPAETADAETTGEHNAHD